MKSILTINHKSGGLHVKVTARSHLRNAYRIPFTSLYVFLEIMSPMRAESLDTDTNDPSPFMPEVSDEDDSKFIERLQKHFGHMNPDELQAHFESMGVVFECESSTNPPQNSSSSVVGELRDSFAASALQGLIAADRSVTKVDDGSEGEDAALFAQGAYLYADAMLAARATGKEDA
jgi:hypothetical protein